MILMKKVEIYTDGACSGNPGPGGFGAIMIYKKFRREISRGFKLTTNSRMEVMAVIAALECLKEPCVVDLYSDSKYVVDAVNKKWLENWERCNWKRKGAPEVLNVDLWIKLLNLIKKHSIRFIWIKGHNRHIENQRCDFLARQAIKSGNLETDSNYKSKF